MEYPADPKQVNISVINEMAKRLRNCNQWDNKLGDGIALMLQQICLLEKYVKFEGFEYEKIRRPLKTWQDCRSVLLAICRLRLFTFTEILAPAESGLTLAVLLYQWEYSGEQIPSDIRLMTHGSIAVEWSKPARTVIIEAGVFTFDSSDSKKKPAP